jgi:FtsP/CotA-like multicopper oxidase with cupredoxin domain
MRRRAVLGLGAGAAALAVGAGWPLTRSGLPGHLLPSQGRRPDRFRADLPVPARPAPVRSDAATDYFDIVQRPARLRILPDRDTPAWTYGGTFPGPTIVSRPGRRTVVRHRNELPEPTVVHLHGGHTPAQSDGYPIDVVLPVDGGAAGGMPGMPDMTRDVSTGVRDYTYPMEQRAATLWYHDHRMGHTGPAVWRGLAGFHLVEDDGPALPSGDRDVPLMITDRSFTEDGSFRYPRMPDDTFMNGVLGDVVLVNGAPWPVLRTEPARYRLRLLNASNARLYRLALDPPPPGGTAFTQIGGDGGLLARPVGHDALELSPAERFDVVVDFGRYRPGTRVRLVNRFGSGGTAEVMAFDVIGPAEATGPVGRDDAPVPARLSEVEVLDPRRAVTTRTFRFMRRRDGTWGVNDLAYRPGRALARPKLGTVEVWRFLTDFHHPVHVHLDHFQVLSRNGGGPGPYDAGWKDTVDVRPAEAVEIVTRFTGYAGSFLLHCHNLEHEDMAMMADFVTEP